MAQKVATDERELNFKEKDIVAAFRDMGSASIQEVAERLDVDYMFVWRRMKRLKDNGWLEVDTKKSRNGKTEYYKPTRIINDGVDVFIESHATGEVRQLSWNEFLATLAGNKGPTKLAAMWDTLLRTVVGLSVCAIKELNEEGSVTEANLLTLRGPLREYRERLILEAQLVGQIVEDNRLWDPVMLKENTLLRTKKPMSTEQLAEFLVRIQNRYNPVQSNEEGSITT